MNTNNQTTKNILKLVFMAMVVGVGVVISPIMRVEGMCPMQHFINVIAAVLLGPFEALACAIMIGVIRMVTMGITPMALTGAVFGAFLSGMLYRVSKGKIFFAVIGEVIGTGIIGAIISYPVMTYLWGRTGLTWLFYVPSFTAATIIGGSLAFIFLKQMRKTGLLTQFQLMLGSHTYANEGNVVNDSLAIAFLGFIFYLIAVVIVNNFMTDPQGIVLYMKYILLAGFLMAGGVYYLTHKEKEIA